MSANTSDTYAYSFLMSVYYKENPNWLDLSIKSMITQTAKPAEIVIVKDGELTAELDKVIEKYWQNDPSLFNIIKLEKNVGLGLALAEGIKHCKYDLVARMDSDDISVPTRCEIELRKFAENSALDIVGCFEAEFEESKENVVSVHRVPETKDKIYSFMKKRCAILHPTVMYKKDSVLKSGNYADVRLYEDYDLFSRMVLRDNCNCYNIQDTLYYIRVNDDFYKRRSGIAYFKTAARFAGQMYKDKYISFYDLIIGVSARAFVYLIPNSWRKFIYKHLLR